MGEKNYLRDCANERYQAAYSRSAMISKQSKYKENYIGTQNRGVKKNEEQ